MKNWSVLDCLILLQIIHTSEGQTVIVSTLDAAAQQDRKMELPLNAQRVTPVSDQQTATNQQSTGDQQKPCDLVEVGVSPSQMHMAAGTREPNGAMAATSMCQPSVISYGPPQAYPHFTMPAYGHDAFAAHSNSFSHPFSITNLIDSSKAGVDYGNFYGQTTSGYGSLSPMMSQLAPPQSTMGTESGSYYHTLYSSNNPGSASNL